MSKGVEPGAAPESAPKESLLARFERAHHQLVGLLARELVETQELGQIRSLLETLPGVLAEHFAEEEGPNGLFDELRAIRPSAAPQLKSLRRAHREMLKAVEALRRDAQEVDAAAQPTPGLARVREQTSAFLRMVQRHERVESRLVADIYYVEDGGSG